VRELEELDPAEGLDEFLVPLFMGPEPVDGATDGANQPGARPQPQPIGAIPKAPPARAELPASTPEDAPRLLPARFLGPVLEDAFSRLVRAETRELRKLLARELDPAGTEAALGELYAEGAAWSELASKILAPALRALAGEVPELETARRIGAAVGRHAVASRQALTGALAGGPAGLRGRLESVIATWSERPVASASEELRRAAGEG
jgi:hypothetical protein